MKSKVSVVVAFLLFLVPVPSFALTYVDLETGLPIPPPSPPPPPTPPAPTEQVVPKNQSPVAYPDPMTGEYYIIQPDGSHRTIKAIVPYGPDKMRIIYPPAAPAGPMPSGYQGGGGPFPEPLPEPSGPTHKPHSETSTQPDQPKNHSQSPGSGNTPSQSASGGCGGANCSSDTANTSAADKTVSGNKTYADKAGQGAAQSKRTANSAKSVSQGSSRKNVQKTQKGQISKGKVPGTTDQTRKQSQTAHKQAVKTQQKVRHQQPSAHKVQTQNAHKAAPAHAHQQKGVHNVPQQMHQQTQGNVNHGH